MKMDKKHERKPTPAYAELMQSEVSYNHSGSIGPNQRKHLQTWLGYCLLICLLFAFFASGWLEGTPWLTWIFLSIVAAFTSVFVWSYGLDLLHGRVNQISGAIRKSTWALRYNFVLYYIHVDEVKIRTTKTIWESLEKSHEYAFYYTPRSKWLMSHTEVESREELADNN